jgi:branched-subunit amino acid transport protein
VEPAVSAAWVVVAGVGLATIAFKAAGPVLLGARRLPERLRAVVELLAPALFAALVVTQTLGKDSGIAIDERLVGVAAAAVAVVLRAPLLAVIVVAAAVTALARAL